MVTALTRSQSQERRVGAGAPSWSLRSSLCESFLGPRAAGVDECLDMRPRGGGHCREQS